MNLAIAVSANPRKHPRDIAVSNNAIGSKYYFDPECMQYTGDFKVVHINLVSPLKWNHEGKSELAVKILEGEKADLTTTELEEKDTSESTSWNISAKLNPAATATGGVDYSASFQTSTSMHIKSSGRVQTAFLRESDTHTNISVIELHDEHSKAFSISSTEAKYEEINNGQKMTVGIFNPVTATEILKDIVHEIGGNFEEAGNILNNPSCLSDSLGDALKQTALSFGHSLENTLGLVPPPIPESSTKLAGNDPRRWQRKDSKTPGETPEDDTTKDKRTIVIGEDNSAHVEEEQKQKPVHEEEQPKPTKQKAPERQAPKAPAKEATPVQETTKHTIKPMTELEQKQSDIRDVQNFLTGENVHKDIINAFDDPRLAQEISESLMNPVEKHKLNRERLNQEAERVRDQVIQGTDSESMGNLAETGTKVKDGLKRIGKIIEPGIKWLHDNSSPDDHKSVIARVRDTVDVVGQVMHEVESLTSDVLATVTGNDAFANATASTATMLLPGAAVKGFKATKNALNLGKAANTTSRISRFPENPASHPTMSILETIPENLPKMSYAPASNNATFSRSAPWMEGVPNSKLSASEVTPNVTLHQSATAAKVSREVLEQQAGTNAALRNTGSTFERDITFSSAERAALEQQATATREALRESLRADARATGKLRELTKEELSAFGFKGQSVAGKRSFNSTTGQYSMNSEVYLKPNQTPQTILNDVLNDLSRTKGTVVRVERGAANNKSPMETHIYGDESRVVFRDIGGSGDPKIEITNESFNTFEKMTIK